MKGIKLTRLASGLAVSIVWKAAKGTHTTSPDTISASSSTSHDLLTGSRVPHVAPILWATTPPNLSCFHLGQPCGWAGFEVCDKSLFSGRRLDHPCLVT